MTKMEAANELVTAPAPTARNDRRGDEEPTAERNLRDEIDLLRQKVKALEERLEKQK